MKRADLNKIVMHMGFYQNEKKQLNAGQLREVVRLYLNAVAELFPVVEQKGLIMAKKAATKKVAKKSVKKMK
jgi:hypothetical protein